MQELIKVELAPGQTVTIEVVELGAAGYVWDLEALHHAVVRLVSREIRLPEPDLGRGMSIGGAAKLVLTLEGIGTGSTEVGMRRPWMPDGEPAATLRVTCS